jgi:hypothetical protein
MRIQIRSKSIPERALFDYTGGGSSFSVLPEGATQLTAVTAVSVAAFTPVRYNGETLVKANLTNPAEYITLSAGNVGDLVTIMKYGEIALITGLDGDLFLGDGILTINPDYTSGRIVQKIGTKTSKNYLIDINHYWKVK